LKTRNDIHDDRTFNAYTQAQTRFIFLVIRLQCDFPSAGHSCPVSVFLFFYSIFFLPLVVNLDGCARALGWFVARFEEGSLTFGGMAGKKWDEPIYLRVFASVRVFSFLHIAD
jgi:hypothetical protein